MKNFFSWALVVLFTISELIVGGYIIYRPTIQDGHIQRTYYQLLPFLDEHPLAMNSYTENIPSILQRDIQHISTSNENLDILYHATNKSSYINIQKDIEGIKLVISTDSYIAATGRISTLSLYKSGEDIIIYFSYTFSSYLHCYKVNGESLTYVTLDNR